MFFSLSNRPILKEHMQYCMSHPEEMSKLSKLKAQINDVKGIMMDNIEKVRFWRHLINSYTPLLYFWLDLIGILSARYKHMVFTENEKKNIVEKDTKQVITSRRAI